jgi:antitoxin component YwqK of YwqJK toxin-antitoxin module
MKKIFILLVFSVAGNVFSQNINPVLEAQDQLVKATYYYDNGQVQQVGFFKDGKLDGKWISYDESGKLKAVAQYTEGKKTGNWSYFSNDICVNDVNFSDNQIVEVKRYHQNALAKN